MRFFCLGVLGLQVIFACSACMRSGILSTGARDNGDTAAAHYENAATDSVAPSDSALPAGDSALPAGDSALPAGDSALPAGDDNPAGGDTAPPPPPGALDPGFGTGGLVIGGAPDGPDVLRDLAVTADGKIVAVGFTESACGAACRSMLVVRFNTNGSVDPSFGSRTLDVAGAGFADEALGVALQSGGTVEGKVVVVGYAELPSGDRDFVLARFNIDGTLDVGFGSNGIVSIPFGPGQHCGYTVAIDQNDGGIVAAGMTDVGAHTDFAAVRLQPANGSLDTTWRSNGVAVDGSANDDRIRKVLVQSNGDVMAVGSTWNGTSSDWAIGRYNRDGSIDAGFGGGFFAITFDAAPQYSTSDEEATDLVMQGSDALVAGWVNETGSPARLFEFARLRVRPDGSLANAYQTFPYALMGWYNGGHTNDVGWSIAMDASGRLWHGGYTDGENGATGTGDDVLIFRTDASDARNLDNTFNGVGALTVDSGDIADRCFVLRLQTDGRVLCAGQAGDDYLLLRIWP